MSRSPHDRLMSALAQHAAVSRMGCIDLDGLELKTILQRREIS
jgi:hypothetical protein